MIQFHVCTLLCLFAIVNAAKLPTYLTQCKRTDPKLNECAKKNGNKAIRDIVKGDIHYDIPSALPLKVPGPIVSKENNQEIVVTDLQIYGLESANISHIEFIFGKGSFILNLNVPIITVEANCHVIGNNFISNHEKLNEKFIGANISYIADFSVEEIDGEMYFTRFEHYDTFQSKEQFNEYFCGVGSLKVYKTVCQERLPKIIEREINEYIFKVFRGIASRVPAKDYVIF